MQKEQDEFSILNHVLILNPYDSNLIPKALREFIKNNQNPDISNNLSSQNVDSFEQLLYIGSIHKKDANVTHLLLKVLKIIMRKELNRRQTNIKLLDFLRETLIEWINYSDIKLNKLTDKNIEDNEILQSNSTTIDSIEKNKSNEINELSSSELEENINEIESKKSEPIIDNQWKSLLNDEKKKSPDNIKKLSTQDISKDSKYDIQRMNEDIACEAANIVLNICYSSYNVLLVTKSGIVPYLLYLLRFNRTSLQASIAGAIQSICFSQEGKRCVIESDGIVLLAPLANSDNITVKMRAIGSLHNLSSDYFIAIKLRDTGIIRPLINILRDSYETPNGNIQNESIKIVTKKPSKISPSMISSLIASCTGCIQNLSREDVARKMIREEGGVEPLVSLLFSEDTFTQKCAAAALLNIIGTEISDNTDHPGRKAFKDILSSCIAVGSLYDAIYNADARPISEKIWRNELQA